VQCRCSSAQPVRLAYQPPVGSTFLSEQTSHQQPTSNTFFSEQTSSSHQPPANRICRQCGRQRPSPIASPPGRSRDGSTTRITRGSPRDQDSGGAKGTAWLADTGPAGEQNPCIRRLRIRAPCIKPCRSRPLRAAAVARATTTTTPPAGHAVRRTGAE
jgi:hypothetical protein